MNKPDPTLASSLLVFTRHGRGKKAAVANGSRPASTAKPRGGLRSPSEPTASSCSLVQTSKARWTTFGNSANEDLIEALMKIVENDFRCYASRQPDDPPLTKLAKVKLRSRAFLIEIDELQISDLNAEMVTVRAAENRGLLGGGCPYCRQPSMARPDTVLERLSEALLAARSTDWEDRLQCRASFCSGEELAASD